MIHDLLARLALPLTADIALNLFTALHTDTGSFRYSNTTARTFRIAAALTGPAPTRAGVRPALSATVPGCPPPSRRRARG
jgi:phosphoesterase RecJ-like protein